MEDYDRYNNNTETTPTQVVSPGMSSTQSPAESNSSGAGIETGRLSSTPDRQSQSGQDSPGQTYQYTPSNDSEQVNTAKLLQRQVNWLKFSLFAAVFVFGGALAGLFFGLRQEQLALRGVQGELSTQVEAVEEALSEEVSSEEQPSDVASPTISLPSAQEISQLSEQVRILSEQAQALSEQAGKVTEQLPNVSIEGAAQQWTDLSERLNALEQSFKNGSSGEAVSEQINQLGEKLSQWLAQASPEASSDSSPNTSESAE